MNLWIVTIGSSDVQLDSDRTSKEKGRSSDKYSEKVWRYWYTDDLKADCNDIQFSPKKLFLDKDETYRISPRILGTVYQAKDRAEQDEIFSYLTFPLLDNFVKSLEKYPQPHAIAILFTDQSDIFLDDEQRGVKSAYWQDTCDLEPILDRYFQEQLPQAELLKFKQCPMTDPRPLTLTPANNTQGLDNWNSVLDQVRKVFMQLPNTLNEQGEHQSKLVYVSHQAGTPALSSAVQFSSLAMYGDRVQFLVSSEHDPKNTQIIESPSYLKGLRREEAIELLKRHDYSGVQKLVSDYLSVEEQILLEAAILWNFAKFDEFAVELQRLTNQELVSLVKERSQTWWWIGYESAYLSHIRLMQENAVEAFFHSFRSVEGLISKWAEVNFPEHIIPNNDSPKLKSSILDVPNLNYFGKKKYEEKRIELQENGTLILSGFPLYALLRAAKPNWKQDCKTLPEFIEKIAPTRNKIFHRLRGLKINDVFSAWLIDLEQDAHEMQKKLDEKIIRYLNFVSEQQFQLSYDASLMTKVHQELEKAIADL